MLLVLPKWIQGEIDTVISFKKFIIFYIKK